jgi:trimeric autotransporter adhesin
MRQYWEVITYRTILMLACVPLFGQQYTISTVAGGGTAGVTLNNPNSSAVDSAGNVYVGEKGLIRKVWAGNAAVTIIAGIGLPGYSGDGGQATSAMLGRISGIALDSAENVYITDVDNNRIRRIDATTGIIETVAGPNAVTLPSALAVDGGGNVYFSSSWSHIQKIIAGTGTIETIAGQVVTGFGGDGGLALRAIFWDPVPSAVGSNGNVYIADYENSRIRMIATDTGIVNTVAGFGACSPAPAPYAGGTICPGGFGGDGGPAVNATLNYASSVALDNQGNLYIADTLNHRIRKVDASTGIISTIAGNGVNGFAGDGGLALFANIGTPTSISVDELGKIYFTDGNNNRIRMLTPVTQRTYHVDQAPQRAR